MLSDPAIYRFIPLEPPADAAALAARYARLAARRSPDGRDRWLNWAVRERATGRWLGLVEATVHPSGGAAVAYLFAPAAQGRGFASEAVRAMMQALVDRHGAAWVEAVIDSRNLRSLALVGRLGFRLVRRVPNADFFKGEPSDELVYRWPAG